jgi:hypothetical protein
MLALEEGMCNIHSIPLYYSTIAIHDKNTWIFSSADNEERNMWHAGLKL